MLHVLFPLPSSATLHKDLIVIWKLKCVVVFFSQLENLGKSPMVLPHWMPLWAAEKNADLSKLKQPISLCPQSASTYHTPPHITMVEWSALNAKFQNSLLLVEMMAESTWRQGETAQIPGSRKPFLPLPCQSFQIAQKYWGVCLFDFTLKWACSTVAWMDQLSSRTAKMVKKSNRKESQRMQKLNKRCLAWPITGHGPLLSWQIKKKNATNMVSK